MQRSVKEINTEEKITLIAKAAYDKKAKGVVILDMKRPSLLCDYFIVASGSSTRQVKAISDNIEEQTRRRGITLFHIEGYNEGKWILLDYHDIVVHVFFQETRDFYNLERLWSDAPRRYIDDIENLASRECLT